MLNFLQPMNTRIAPSNTGNAHIGLIRTVYLNYLAAKSSGGKFILRIDDTDSKRSQDQYTKNIIDTFNWLGLDYFFSFSQSQNFDLYKTKAIQLLDTKKAIIKDGCIVLKPESIQNGWTDLVCGNINITDDKHGAINNLILVKSDGTPTYHFATVIDDIICNINLIIRGTDHIDNTAKHIHIYNAFEAVIPTYAHVGLIFHNKKKISKRDGISDISTYKNYNPQAILNAVLKLGWSHTNPNIDKIHPLIDMNTAIQLFPEGHLKAASSSLDLNKLDWLNKKYQ